MNILSSIVVFPEERFMAVFSRKIFCRKATTVATVDTVGSVGVWGFRSEEARRCREEPFEFHRLSASNRLGFGFGSLYRGLVSVAR